MKVRLYEFNSLPFVTIVDEADCPINPYVSSYLSGALAAKSANTRLRYANELLFVLQYFQSRSIDIPARVASGSLISLKEYSQFYEECCLSKSNSEQSVSINFLAVKSKALRNIMAANQRGLARVSRETLQGRVRCFRRFLSWLFQHFHDIAETESELRKRFGILIAHIKINENALGKNGPGKVIGPDESVLPDSVFVDLLEMVRPSSPNNPFKTAKVRNYLIVNLLIQSGVRRGALAKSKISDYNFFGEYDSFSVYRSGCDPSDTRREKPNQKTKAHLASIQPWLMKCVELYINLVRENFPRAQFHDYLLISESDSKGTAGLPLSLKSINAIFQKLSGILRFHLHPHLLRHKWNEIFDENGERLGVDPLLLEDVRKYAMGWSSGSSMTQVYNDKRLAKKARDISRAYQEKVDLGNGS